MKNFRETVKQNQAVTTEILIRQLNRKLIGWANYYRHYCSKDTFGRIGKQLFPILWRWAKQRHRRKGSFWIFNKYFRTKINHRWQFFTKIKDKDSKMIYLDLVQIAHTPVKRHVKIKSDATPFDPAYEKYFRI